MKKFLLMLGLLTAPLTAHADMSGFIDQLKQDIVETWAADTYDAYVPVYTWHNRLFYDQEKIEKYNEEPWGFGIGKSRYEYNGNWHGLYAMAFKDSNFYVETMFGYAFQKNWFVNCNRDFMVGVGYTLGFTQRHEYSYIPVSLPLPLAGITYKKLSLQAAYVPGIKNDGNVLFTWLRWQIN